MSAVRSLPATRWPVLWLAVAPALLSALAYVLIVRGLLAVGDLARADDAIAMFYVAAGCYLLGGLLILVRNRWLWIVGHVMNAVVILFFFQKYVNDPTIMFSPGGLMTKAAQILLGLFLLYLIAVGRRSLGDQPKS